MSMMDCVKLAVDFLSKAISETVKEGTDPERWGLL